MDTDGVAGKVQIFSVGAARVLIEGQLGLCYGDSEGRRNKTHFLSTVDCYSDNECRCDKSYFLSRSTVGAARVVMKGQLELLWRDS